MKLPLHKVNWPNERAYKRTVKPSFMAMVRAGTVKPKDGIDEVLFGTNDVAPCPIWKAISASLEQTK